MSLRAQSAHLWRDRSGRVIEPCGLPMQLRQSLGPAQSHGVPTLWEALPARLKFVLKVKFGGVQ